MRPASNTPQARAVTRFSGGNQGANQTALAMMAKLNSTGVKAGTANCRWVLKMPQARAVSEMNKM